uniref:Uncharacterized protein n=1 Tax=Arundo donax TaxID=35708 RepID=A0A0A9G990_ARUDO
MHGGSELALLLIPLYIHFSPSWPVAARQAAIAAVFSAVRRLSSVDPIRRHCGRDLLVTGRSNMSPLGLCGRFARCRFVVRRRGGLRPALPVVALCPSQLPPRCPSSSAAHPSSNLQQGSSVVAATSCCY